MSASEVFSLGDRAVARRTDPETSHEAAESVKGISDFQEWILWTFQTDGPMTDEMAYISLAGIATPSGYRSRRSELVAKGLLEWTGRWGGTKAGRKARIWQVVKR